MGPRTEVAEEVEAEDLSADDIESTDHVERDAPDVEMADAPTLSFTPDVTERIRQIMAPRPIEARILTPIPTIEGIDGKATLKQ